MNETKWLIWSIEHNGWWAPGGSGYTKARKEAGRFTHDEALAIVTNANNHIRSDWVNEAMCPDWTPVERTQ